MCRSSFHLNSRNIADALLLFLFSGIVDCLLLARSKVSCLRLKSEAFLLHLQNI